MPVFIKWLLFNWFFEASCNKHDIGYAKGGTEIDRFKCDWKFWLAMKADVSRLWWPLQLVALITAIVFFIIVRVGGWYQFKYKDD